jgi:hypothetical protein
MTIAERAKVQMEERERKLKDLQDQLMAEYTFTPQRAASTHSVASSITTGTTPPDRSMVFERLYNRETAAIRARRASAPRPSQRSPLVSSSNPRPKGLADGYVTPTRVEALFHQGVGRLRARVRNDEVSMRVYCGERFWDFFSFVGLEWIHRRRSKRDNDAWRKSNW